MCLKGTQDWESWWVLVSHGSHTEPELQHGRSCCSSLNVSAHQWLCKTGQRDLDQEAWLWQGSWANLSPFWPARGTIWKIHVLTLMDGLYQFCLYWCGRSSDFVRHTWLVLLAQLVQSGVCSTVWAAVIKCKYGQITLNNFSIPEILKCTLWEKNTDW